MNCNERKLRRREGTSSAGEAAIKAAMRLAGDEAVESVQVVTRDRSTYQELLELRQAACAQGLNLIVHRTGVSLKRRHKAPVVRRQRPVHQLPDWATRPAALAPPPAGSIVWMAAAPRTGVERQTAPLRQWLDSRGREWRAGLAALSEGTR